MEGGGEILLILFVVLLLFGGKKLPELARSLGRSVGEFRKGKQDIERQMRDMQCDAQREIPKPEVSLPTAPSEPDLAMERPRDENRQGSGRSQVEGDV